MPELSSDAPVASWWVELLAVFAPAASCDEPDFASVSPLVSWAEPSRACTMPSRILCRLAKTASK